MVDILTGLYAANAIQAALRHRDRTGEGQHIDMSLLDCGLAALSHYVQNYLISGIVPERRGNGGYGGVPSQTFRCADAEIFVVASTNKQFVALAQVLGRPDIPQDPRFCDVSTRIENRDALLIILEGEFAKRRADQWLLDLDEADVPASPINDVRTVFDNPQIRHRGMLASVDHAIAGEVPVLRNPIRMSATPIPDAAAPPTLGQDTIAILRDLLGRSDEEIASLRMEGVI